MSNSLKKLLTEFKYLEQNSINVKKGSIFLAYPGESNDGRKYIGEAIKKGAGAIIYDPLDFKSYFELGLAYLALGRHEEEVRAYKEALRLNPKYAKAHYNLSMAYDYMKEGAKAIYHMQKALDLYATKRNHRKIRTTQRQLKRFYMSYPNEAGSSVSEKTREP